jgi:hypothetical protein
MMGNRGGNRLEIVINEVLAAFIVNGGSEKLTAPSSK